MPMGIIHFAVGGILTTLLVTFVRPRLCYPHTAAVVGGIWAMVPDVWWLLLFVDEGLAATFKTFHGSSVANLFWFHHFLDANEVGSPLDRAVGAVALAFLLAVVLLAEYRHNARMHGE